jgi:hypothetical protein
MKSVSALAFALFVSATVSAQQSWTGQISDSMCKTKHEETAEGAGKLADHDCTLSCVKGGSKYVLVADGKVYQISNQSLPDLEKYAGETVTVSGTAAGDTITASKIQPAGK